MVRIRVAATAKIAFRSAAADDVVAAAIQGAPCRDARFRIVIRAASGDLLYQHDEPFKRHTAIPSDDGERLVEEAKALVEETLSEGISETSAALPAFEELAGTPASAAVSPARYAALRARALHAIVHATHFESWQWVVFDPEENRAVVVLRGGI